MLALIVHAIHEGRHKGRPLRGVNVGDYFADADDINCGYVIASESTARMALLKQEEASDGIK